jgi:hypothetical protein
MRNAMRQTQMIRATLLPYNRRRLPQQTMDYQTSLSTHKLSQGSL